VGTPPSNYLEEEHVTNFVKRINLWGVWVALALASGAAFSYAAFAQESKAEGAFAKLLKLEGTWKIEGMSGPENEMVYKVVSDGHTVSESLWGMVTMYHLDGDSVMATHYCSANNQPRMRSVSASANPTSLSFDFVDVTNLKPGGGHISGIRFEFDGDDRFVQTWLYRVGGVDQEGEKITLSRVRKQGELLKAHRPERN
jgi:hypothetical protein